MAVVLQMRTKDVEPALSSHEILNMIFDRDYRKSVYKSFDNKDVIEDEDDIVRSMNSGPVDLE